VQMGCSLSPDMLAVLPLLPLHEVSWLLEESHDRLAGFVVKLWDMAGHQRGALNMTMAFCQAVTPPGCALPMQPDGM